MPAQNNALYPKVLGKGFCFLFWALVDRVNAAERVGGRNNIIFTRSAQAEG